MPFSTDSHIKQNKLKKPQASIIKVAVIPLYPRQ